MSPSITFIFVAKGRKFSFKFHSNRKILLILFHGAWLSLPKYIWAQVTSMKQAVGRLCGSWALRDIRVDTSYEYCSHCLEKNRKHGTGPYLPGHGPCLPVYFDGSKKHIIYWKLSRDKIVDPRCLISGTLCRRKAISRAQSEKPGLATAHWKKMAFSQNRPIPPGSPLFFFRQNRW